MSGEGDAFREILDGSLPPKAVDIITEWLCADLIVSAPSQDQEDAIQIQGSQQVS